MLIIGYIVERILIDYFSLMLFSLFYIYGGDDVSTNMVTRTKRIKKSSNILDTITSIFTAKKINQSDEFYNALEGAKREWVDSQIYFDNVSDPELVDYAIHMMEASETKYMYLLNKAKKENYSVDLSRLI